MSEHIVKQSYGTMWHFCHNSQGICFCKMTDERIREYEILLKNGQKDFDILIDDADCIHLICQDDTGNIIYIKNEEKEWKKYTVMQSKTPSPYNKSFNIQRVGNWINIFYTIDYKGKKLLSHQILDSTDIPNAVDYVDGDYSVCKDKYGNIYALYNNISGDLGFREFIWSKKEWSDFKRINASGELKNPYIYADEKIHIAGIVGNNTVYLSDLYEIPVGPAGSNPIIIKSDSLMSIMWENKRDGKVWTAKSIDNGASFQSPTEFMASKFAPIKLFSLASTSFEKSYARHCYGYIRDNVIFLYMLNDFLKVSQTPPKPFTPSYQQAYTQKDGDIELTKLKILVTQLSESVNKLNNRLDMLEKKQGE